MEICAQSVWFLIVLVWHAIVYLFVCVMWLWPYHHVYKAQRLRGESPYGSFASYTLRQFQLSGPGDAETWEMRESEMWWLKDFTVTRRIGLIVVPVAGWWR
jgi:hypothetical protein